MVTTLLSSASEPASKGLKKLMGMVRGLSLKMRLGIIFIGLMILAIQFSVLTLFQYHKMAIHGSTRAVREHSELEKTIQLRDLINSLDRYSQNEELRVDHIARGRRLFAELRSVSDTVESRRLLDTALDRFETYGNMVSLPRTQRKDSDVRNSFEEAAASVGALIDLKQMTVYRTASELRREYETGLRNGLILLVLFIVVLVIGALKAIGVVTGPLSELSQVLDSVKLEEDLPDNLPPMSGDSPEIARVAQSFDQLVQRLRGYRAINFRRLLVEKRRTDIIAASISDGVFLLRGDELLFVNPVGEKILGLAKDQAWRGLNVASASKPGEGSALDEHGRPALKISRGVQAVAAAVARTIPVEFELVTEDQRKLYYLVQSYPISEEIIEQVEHSFDAPTEHLIERWKANTLVIARDITLVRESQEAKSHFLATLSHEVKTPVTSLTMATRLLKKVVDQIPSPTHRQLIMTCADDVDRLRKLLEDLLNVTRFDALTQKLDIQHVDVGRLIKQQSQFFQPQAFERGIELAAKIGPEARNLEIRVDPTKISWAFSNLMTNAIRHTPKGGKVEIILAANATHVEIKIRDSGPGIDRSRQDRIFDKFSPFYDLRVARSGSVGMGLAIAREIIAAHGGRIWMTSEPGMGAEFCFSLPLPAMVNPTQTDKMKEEKGDYSGASARS